jgi:GNAT superfamily N-acetyltransferase
MTGSDSLPERPAVEPGPAERAGLAGGFTAPQPAAGTPATAVGRRGQVDDATPGRTRSGLRRRARPGGRPSATSMTPTPRDSGRLAVGPVDRWHSEAVTALHRRCSVRTLEDRYRGPASEADGYLPHLLSPRFGRSLAVWDESGGIVGVGHLLWDGDEAEVAVLVADAWQRRGVGTGLLRRLVHTAGTLDRTGVYAVAQPPGAGMVALMGSLGLPVEVRYEEDAVVISAGPVPAPPWQPPAGRPLRRYPVR